MKRSKRRVAAAGCLAAAELLAGCSAPHASERAVPVLMLEEIARYGNGEGKGAALSVVTGVALTDSTLLVLDGDPARVAVFGYDGAWHRDIGREGDGPGELRGPSSITVLHGRIWVGDPRGRRLEVFGRGGAGHASYRWSLPPDSLGAPALPMAPLEDGSLLAGPGALMNVGAIANGRITHRDYFSADSSGTVVDTLYRESLERGDFTVFETGPGRVAVGRHPLRQSPLVALYPDGSGLVAVERREAAMLNGAAFRVRVIEPDGTTELDLDVPYEPLPAEGWLEEYVELTEREMIARSGSADRGLLDAIRDGLADRTFHPPVTAVRAGGDGTIWVRREEVAAADSVAWQVFARAGELVATLSAPKALELMLTSREEVWAVERDELDVPYVLHMRVREATP